MIDDVGSAEVGGAAGVLRLGSCRSNDENRTGKRAPQVTFHPPAAVKQKLVGSPFRQFAVHSLHRLGLPERTTRAVPLPWGRETR